MGVPVIGKRFSRLVVCYLSHLDKRHRKHYMCQCDCGTQKTVQGTLLLDGNTRSCGCLSREAKQAQRLPNDAGVINQIILQYKRHARDRGIGWFLKFEDVDRVVRMSCHYCGVRAGNFKKTKNHPGFAYNGIDRADPAVAYRSSNIVPCCGFCNKAKQSLGDEEFIAWAKRVAAQWGGAASVAVAE